MTEETNINNRYKCPLCTCIFCNQKDLQKHMATFGGSKEQHEDRQKSAHGRLEYGYSDE